jgi:hypothetical protein
LDESITEFRFGQTESLIPELPGQPAAVVFEASAARFAVETYSYNWPVKKKEGK